MWWLLLLHMVLLLLVIVSWHTSAALVLLGLLLRLTRVLNLNRECHLGVCWQALRCQHLSHRMKTAYVRRAAVALRNAMMVWMLLRMYLLLLIGLLRVEVLLPVLGGLLHHLIKLSLCHLDNRQFTHLRVSNYGRLLQKLLLQP